LSALLTNKPQMLFLRHSVYSKHQLHYTDEIMTKKTKQNQTLLSTLLHVTAAVLCLSVCLSVCLSLSLSVCVFSWTGCTPGTCGDVSGR